MPNGAANSVTIELDALKRMIVAARLSRFSERQAAESAAEDDIAVWRTRANGPQQVELTVEAAEQISAAALTGLAGVQDCDQTWRTLVVSDLRHVADACRKRR